MSSSYSLNRIRLELARSKDEPNGSDACGYDFVAPLDGRGHIDVEGWKESRSQCTSRRFWSGEDDRTGMLVHRAGGSDGATWMFDYDDNRSDDDEAGYRLGMHAFVPGEYVTVHGQKGEKTFRVAAVEDII